jgi:hypothetical protein
MEIKTFHDFRIYEKKGDPVEQNTPSKTGNPYRDNMNIPKQDTGDDSAGLYTIFLTQAASVLKSMSTNVLPINPDKANGSINRIIAISGDENIKPTYESHRKLWGEIEKISDYLGGDWQNASKGKLSSLNAFDQEGLVLDTFRKSITDLDQQRTTKKISDTQYEEEASKIRVEANSQLVKSNSLYYMKIGKALDYYMQAIKVYKKGAIVCLQNMESESEEEENRTTGKRYLQIITKEAKNILGKN